MSYEHSCRKAGAEGCGYTIRAGSEEELKSKVQEHARRVHGVKNMTDTIYNYLRDSARR
jgi:predicted small metal-binding protein